MKILFALLGFLGVIGGAGLMFVSPSAGAGVLVAGAIFVSTSVLLERADDLAALVRWIGEKK